jgi:hypothetical protein
MIRERPLGLKRILVSTSTQNGVMSLALLYSSLSLTSSTPTIFLLPARTMWRFRSSSVELSSVDLLDLVLLGFAGRVLHIEILSNIFG